MDSTFRAFDTETGRERVRAVANMSWSRRGATAR
jgi:hypothetical protein